LPKRETRRIAGVVELEAQLKDTQATRDGLEAQILKELEDRTFNPTAFEELIAGLSPTGITRLTHRDGNGDYYLRPASARSKQSTRFRTWRGITAC
jgi:hypothetical protein